MPKNKLKKDSTGVCQDSARAQQPSMAPQAAAHRRGGTHKVRDQDRTNSIYDDYNYKELLDTAKERGIYRKDMKKVEMAWALKNNDDDKKRAEHNAIVERQRREQEEKRVQKKKDDGRQAILKAKHERNMLKEMKRKRGEVVSEDSMDEEQLQAEHDRLNGRDEYTRENVGQAPTDESWDSTSTESTARSANRPIAPDCKLRLFEWPYLEMPLLNPLPSSLLSPSILASSEPLPFKVPYAPLKIVTTKTKQRLFLPGQKYPIGVDADYAPVLSLQTRLAARNGVLEGVLRKAIIERASEWAERTQVQGWNARMFFSLPSRNETKDLAEVYNKWYMENRKLLRVKGRGNGARADREQRHAQRQRNKGKKVVEVYEACQYRPLAVCYIPSYLDFHVDQRVKGHVKGNRSLNNLFYIRFPGCEVPHYYFWTNEGEWTDPTIPNPTWYPTKMRQVRHGCPGGTPQPAQRQPHKTWKAPHKLWARVKKLDVAHEGLFLPSDPSNFATTLTKIEQELYDNGLASTLAKYRMKWLANGKQHAWKVFARVLPTVYPSGQMPNVPPVETHSGEKVAIKLAMIENLGEDEQTPLSPLRGDEAWTRDDDTLWDVVEVDAPTPTMHTEEDIQEELGRLSEHESEVEALYRRGSATFQKSIEEFSAWLGQVSPSYVPPTPVHLPETPTIEDTTTRERDEWEGRTLWPIRNKISLICPFCRMEWETMTSGAQAEHMWSHSTDDDGHSRRSSTEQYSVFALPLRARRPSCRITPYNNTLVDAAVDGDVDTPTATKTRRPALRVSARRSKTRRPSTQPYAPSSPSSHVVSPPLRVQRRLSAGPGNAAWDPCRHSTSGSEHVKSPYLPCVKRYPSDHPNAAWNLRKRSCSSIDSLEFLQTFAKGKRKTIRRKRRTGEGEPQIKTLPYRPRKHGENNHDVSPMKLYFLEREGSNAFDPTYINDSSTLRSSKRRETDDPTYRDTPLFPVLSDGNLPPLTKNRKRPPNPSYRDTLLSPASSVEALPVLKKRYKIADPTFQNRPVSLSASSSNVKPTRRRRRKVRKVIRAETAMRGDGCAEDAYADDLDASLLEEAGKGKAAEDLNTVREATQATHGKLRNDGEDRGCIVM